MQIPTKDVAIIIPLYNEESVIQNILTELKEQYPNYVIIVVDDCSSDNSFSMASVEEVYILKHIINLGQGAALQTGLEFAMSLKCKYAVTFDSDGQHDPNDILPFVRALENNDADIVLGSRFLGKTENMPTRKKYLLKASRIFTWITTGLLLTCY